MSIPDIRPAPWRQQIPGLGKAIARLVLLKPMGGTDDSEKGLVVEAILLVQHAPEMIAAELPSTETEQMHYSQLSMQLALQTTGPATSAAIKP